LRMQKLSMLWPCLAVGAIFLIAACAGFGDEGMWLYNQPPRKQLREKYGFELSDAWLEHLQKASVRYGGGASAEFVSEDGLLLSNHHVGSGAIQKLSSAAHNYMRDGFYARTLAEEKQCPGLEVNVLMSIEDVTARIQAAVRPGLDDRQAEEARRAAMAAIEKECVEQTGLRGEVVTLYQGAQYHLYRYKRYTDVRLVFAPEEQIAFFGGDPDNFEYPRYDLDICLFRVYENGRPVRPEHFLKINPKGAAENELVFVSGHPGRTGRLLTVAELEHYRDVRLPYMLSRLKSLEVALAAWSERSPENARRARQDLFGIQNSRKVRDGEMAGLLAPSLIDEKRRQEQLLREAAARDARFAQAAGAWDRIARAQETLSRDWVRYQLLEGGNGFGSSLFSFARHLLRSGVERAKPNSERLREYSQGRLPSLELALFSQQPIYDDLEQLKMAEGLTSLATQLGCNHPLVRQVLAGKSPRERAAELVAGTRLKDAAYRRKLYEGGAAAVDAAKDPMIELARIVEPEARALRQAADVQNEILRQAHAQIESVRFGLYGPTYYPDATGTLRLAFGVVKGYLEEGRAVPHQTTLAGLYQRAAEHFHQPPFDLPARWLERKKKLNLDTPMNFVCTADIIGGNSGSPVVNRNGELVGVIFDGNIQSLVADFVYSEEQNRALAVHAAAIVEALVKIYDARPLVDELLGRRRPR